MSTPAFEPPKKWQARRKPETELIRIARGVVTGDYLVPGVHGSVDEWQVSLMLFVPYIKACRNLGMVVVPMQPHMGGRWLNGSIPGITIEAEFVAKGDMKVLTRHIEAMEAALHPEES